jgi:hypothetical protein
MTHASTRTFIAARSLASRATRRALLATAAAAATIAVAGCGGGVELGVDGFSMAVTIDGNSYGPPVVPGAPLDVGIQAGQSVTLEANEPAVWTMVMGSTAVPADGVAWFYAGATLRATAISSTRVVLDTSSSGPLPAPVPVTLTARSTYDSALVAVVNVSVF